MRGRRPKLESCNPLFSTSTDKLGRQKGFKNLSFNTEILYFHFYILLAVLSRCSAMGVQHPRMWSSSTRTVYLSKLRWAPTPTLLTFLGWILLSWYSSLMQTFNLNFLLGIHKEDNAEDDVRAKDKEDESAASTNTVLTLRIWQTESYHMDNQSINQSHPKINFHNVMIN